MRCFWAYLCLFLFLGGVFIFVGQSLWSCLDCIQVLHFVLYLFSSYHIGFTLLGYSCQEEYILMFLVSNCLFIYVYEFFIDICLYCVLFEIKILFFFTCIFFHTCGYAFCLSISGNIQVDSIKLLSTLAIDGQQLRLNLSFMSIIL